MTDFWREKSSQSADLAVRRKGSHYIEQSRYTFLAPLQTFSASVAEPPHFWAAPAPTYQKIGSGSGAASKLAAPGGPSSATLISAATNYYRHCKLLGLLQAISAAVSY